MIIFTVALCFHSIKRRKKPQKTNHHHQNSAYSVNKWLKSKEWNVWNDFPTQFCLESGLNSFLLCSSHAVPHRLGWASRPRSWASEWTLGRLQFRLSRHWTSSQPLCQASSALSFGVCRVLEAANLCGAAALKPQGQPWPFALEVLLFPQAPNTTGVPCGILWEQLCAGAACGTEMILSEMAWERNKGRQNNKYTCMGLLFFTRQ